MTESTNRNRGRGKVRRTVGPPVENPQSAQVPPIEVTAPVTFTEPTPVTAPAASASDTERAPQSDRGEQSGRRRSSSESGGRSDGGRGGNNSDGGRGGSNSGGGRGGNTSGGGRGGSGSGGNNSGGGNTSGGGRGGNTSGGGRGGSGSGGNTSGGGRGGNSGGRGGNSGDGGRGRGGRGRGQDNSTPTAKFGGVKTMQGADLTTRLPAPPKPKKGVLRVVALGGVSEIGRNMTVFEYEGKLLIVDCGVLFPSSTEPGVDLILPDFGHIEDRLDQVEALVLTHGHEDHIGAIPFLLKLRADIPVVGSRFTLALVAAKCKEHRIKPKFVEVDESSRSTFGDFTVEYFAVSHSIPDAIGVVIHAGEHTVMMSGDIKLDQLPPDKRPTDLPAMSRFGDAGVDLLLLDSTNATTPGVSPSESGVKESLQRLITTARQLVVVACFASNVYRVQAVIDAAHASGRKVALNGRSMLRNMEIAQELGLLTDPGKVVIDMEQAGKLPSEKLVVVTTGTQGEPMAGLSRMARREHRQVNLGEGDRVLFSSSLVPGNEEAVYGVMNGLSQMGVEVVTGHDAPIHVSGHGYSGELLFIYNAVRPKNAMPVHGEWRHLRANKALAIATGVPEDRVVLAQNGVVVELDDHVARVVGQIPVGHLYVDGLSTGDVGDNVLADRTTLGEGGFIAATVVVDPRTGRPVGRPQIIGKGFTDEPGALTPVVELVENALLDLAGEGETDPYRLAQAVRRTIGNWVADKWRRKSMIVPTVITSAVEGD